MVRKFSGVGIVLLLLFPEVGSGTAASDRLVGFRESRVAAHLDLEARFDRSLDAAELMEWSRWLTTAPHHLGSPKARANAERMLELFRSWGFDARIETFDVLFPTPRVRQVTLLEPHRFEAKLREEAVPGDPSSQVAVAEGLPSFNAYSADGDVTAELVYVNRGVPEDYEELERLGIDVRGKIVIARYGGSWRGIKPKVAAEKGAIGCLIYNDPADDGFTQGEVYPDGAYKHDSGVQRGSVLDLPLRPGDPLTPMRGATAGAARLERRDAETIMKIPVLPLAWRDALPLLQALQGPVAESAWRGALPITYRIGPGPAKVRIRLEFDWRQVPAYDVIAVLRGAERPDQWIVRGNHHDAWVIGGRDPISGLIGLLAEAKAVGALAATGWRPKRTLVYAAWDGEEPGLLGSTEWVEQHAQELAEKAAVYINSDSNGRGFLGVGGSQALEQLVNEVASAVPDPQTGTSVAARLLAARKVAASPAELAEIEADPRLQVEALGSGSDYSPFFQHLGIPSLNVGFGGEGPGGEYHTAFDTHAFFQRFVDPGAAYGVALAKTAGRMSLRLAEADVLPFDYRTTAKAIAGYVDEVLKLAESERDEIGRTNRLLRERAYQLAADPTKHRVPPMAKVEPPHLNWAPLLDARDRLERSARGFDLERLAGALEPALQIAADRELYSGERLLTRVEGLPRRPWYRHYVFAPGFYTGYGVKTLPGVREAIEEGAWGDAQHQIGLVAERIEALATRLEGIASGLPASAQGGR